MAHQAKTPETYAAPRPSATTADLCALLRLSPGSIRRLELEGRIPPPIRIGRKKLWPAETVAAILAAAQVKEGGAA